MNNNNHSCIERERPADNETSGPDSLDDSSNPGIRRDLVTVHRRNPGATARRHKRYLWEAIFQSAFEVARDKWKENLNLAILEATTTADLAVAEWVKRWESSPAEGAHTV